MLPFIVFFFLHFFRFLWNNKSTLLWEAFTIIFTDTNYFIRCDMLVLCMLMFCYYFWLSLFEWVKISRHKEVEEKICFHTKQQTRGISEKNTLTPTKKNIFCCFLILLVLSTNWGEEMGKNYNTKFLVCGANYFHYHWTSKFERRWNGNSASFLLLFTASKIARNGNR